jgi:hypothetical protein
MIIGLASLICQMHMLGSNTSTRPDGVHFYNTIANATRRVAHTVQVVVEGDGSPANNTTSDSVRLGLDALGPDILWGIVYFISVVVGCLVLYLLITSLRPTTRADVWDDVAKEDPVLGDAPGITPNGTVAYRTADQRHVDMLNAINNESWRETLWTFFTWIRVDSNWLNHMRGRAARRQARRRVDQELLRMRDIVFHVRNTIFTKVSKEAVSEHTKANRLIVARHAEEVFERLKLDPVVRGRIREACVNACFIQTVYDEAGLALLKLGPDRRPV